MRITCPACLSEYDVPGTVAPGRNVRCARCGEQWVPVAPAIGAVEDVPAFTGPEPVSAPGPVAPEPALSAPPLPTPAVPGPVVPDARPDAVAVPAPNRAALLGAWLASAAVLAALVAAAVIWREPAMAAWPPSARVYGWLGLLPQP